MNGSFHVIIRPLPEERGGGFEATVLEIPGLTVYGMTIEEVKAKVMRRIESWMGLTRRLGWIVNVDYSVKEQSAVYCEEKSA